MTKSADLSQWRISYDSVADVLYLSLGAPDRNARSSEDERGLVWRIAANGKPQGVTVQAFNQLWGQNEKELVNILAKSFKVPMRELSSELAAAH